MRSFDISLQKTLKTQKYCQGFLNASGDVVYEKNKLKKNAFAAQKWSKTSDTVTPDESMSLES